MLRFLVLVFGLITFSFGLGHGKDRQVQAFRVFMPEAGPSAFGVVLNPETALCYDPLRGGVNQAWRGSLDLSPTLRAKINEPAKIQGEVFYAETTFQPLRINDPGKVPVRRFKGYAYDEKGVTFSYLLDGASIQETLTATADGRGLKRRWDVPAGITLYFLADPQAKAAVAFEGGTETTPGAWKFGGGAPAVFLMTITPH
jgi:hypothetical protein